MTALLDAVATAAAAAPRLYALNSVPASPTYPYGVFSAAEGRGDAYTLDSAHGLRWLGVNVQTFGKTANSALGLMETITAALLDQSLTLGSVKTTPLRASLDSPAVNRDPDDNGVVTVAQRFTATRRR